MSRVHLCTMYSNEFIGVQCKRSWSIDRQRGRRQPNLKLIKTVSADQKTGRSRHRTSSCCSGVKTNKQNLPLLSSGPSVSTSEYAGPERNRTGCSSSSNKHLKISSVCQWTTDKSSGAMSPSETLTSAQPQRVPFRCPPAYIPAPNGV